MRAPAILDHLTGLTPSIRRGRWSTSTAPPVPPRALEKNRSYIQRPLDGPGAPPKRNGAPAIRAHSRRACTSREAVYGARRARCTPPRTNVPSRRAGTPDSTAGPGTAQLADTGQQGYMVRPALYAADPQHASRAVSTSPTTMPHPRLRPTPYGRTKVPTSCDPSRESHLTRSPILTYDFGACKQ